jgi:CheY-specific phosphatase CheX
MEQPVNGFVRDVMEASVRELFDSYGLACSLSAEHGESPTESVELGSIVGFRGKGIRGGLAFVAPLDLIAKLLPVPRDVTRADLQLRDWSAEIANQLVGRIKNKLSSRTLDFDVGTPVCFTGKSIRLVFLPDADGLSLAVTAADSTVRIHLDCTLSSDIVGGELDPLRIVPEGEVLLF